MFEGRDDVISEAKTYLENDSTVQYNFLSISHNIICSLCAKNGKNFHPQVDKFMDTRYKIYSPIEYLYKAKDKCNTTVFKHIN